MLRLLGYIWFAFGVYWILLAPRPGADSGSRSGRPLKLTALAVLLALLFWRRDAIPPLWLTLLGLLWAVMALYWIAPAKPARSGEHPLYRLLRIAILSFTFALLFWPNARGFLGTRLFPPLLPFAALGFLLALSGLSVSLWARVHLGQYWSDKVVLQPEHQLVRTGPYRHVRHPIYTGVLLAVLGTALVLNQWRGLLAFALLLLNYAIKAKREERILTVRFGNGFLEYAKQTGFLLPRLRL